MVEMNLGLEVALLLGTAGMGILVLPWSAMELSDTWRALGEAAEWLAQVRRGQETSLVPGGSKLSVAPAPTCVRISA